MARNKKKIFSLFLIGTAFILFAGMLFLHNRLEDKKASDLAEEVLEQFHMELDNRKVEGQFLYTKEVEPEIYIPDYILNPNMEMPTTEIEGNRYVGYLYFPSLEVELPVMSNWSYPGLKIAPCLYSGSIYNGDAVIAAHNYTGHFGQLYNLEPGDPIRFIDADGNVFSYEVVIQEVLDSTAIEDMTTSSFDLSLFTCTYGGASRFTVRCRAL